MTKVIKMGALSGSLRNAINNSICRYCKYNSFLKIADEYIQGKASTALNIGAGLLTGAVAPITIAGYSPTTIPAISLANGTVVLSASSGSLAVADAQVLAGTHKIVIMEDNAAVDSDVVIGVYANTFGGKLSFYLMHQFHTLMVKHTDLQKLQMLKQLLMAPQLQMLSPSNWCKFSYIVWCCKRY